MLFVWNSSTGQWSWVISLCKGTVDVYIQISNNSCWGRNLKGRLEG